MPYQIEYSETPAPEDVRVLEEGLRESAVVDWQRQSYRPLAFFVRDTGVVLGGVVGNTGGPWLYIGALWVTDDLRGRRIGTKLMDAVEGEAIARGCTGAYLDTFSPSALEFYRSRGYVHFGQLDAGPAHPVRHFLRRVLSSAAAGHEDT